MSSEYGFINRYTLSQFESSSTFNDIEWDVEKDDFSNGCGLYEHLY